MRPNPLGTGSGTAPGLPIWSYWLPGDKTWASLHATFPQNRVPTTDLTFCSGAGAPLRSAPRRESLRKTFPLLTNEELRRNSRRRRRTWGEIEWKGCTGWFHLVKWSENSAECPFLSPQSNLFFSPLSFRQLPRFHPACKFQMPRGLARQLGTSDRNWKPCCLHGPRAKEADVQKRAESVSVSIWATAGRGVLEMKVKVSNFAPTCKSKMLK